MANPIRALLIAPETRVIRVVEWDQEFESLTNYLCCSKVESHTLLTMGKPVTLWCDEEWPLKAQPINRSEHTRFKGVPTWFGGRLLLTGEADAKGDATDFDLDPEEVATLLEFAGS